LVKLIVKIFATVAVANIVKKMGLTN